MSEFSDMMSEGFAEMLPEVGSLLMSGGLSCTVIGGALELTKALQDTGLWEKATATVDISQADFNRLKLKDHSKVIFGGKTLFIILIEPDQVDPIVKIHLSKWHGNTPNG